MSELENKPVENEPVKITTNEKPKNPNRVEWGRKLSKLSAAAKKKKKEEGKQVSNKLESIKETTEKDLAVDKSYNNYAIAFGIGGLLIGGLGLYYQRKTFNKEIVVDKPEIMISPAAKESADMMMME